MQQQQQHLPLTGKVPVKKAATSRSPDGVVRVSRRLSCSDPGGWIITSRGSTSKLDSSCRKGACSLFGAIIGFSFRLQSLRWCFCMGAFYPPAKTTERCEYAKAIY